MRVLRAVRLLQRGSLKVLMDALAGALEPVVQSFLLLGLVSSIYAIMGVALFSQQAPHIFGSFFKALFTIFSRGLFRVIHAHWRDGLGQYRCCGAA